MNLGRVKTFLIILFLGINIYLIAAGFSTTRFYLDKDTVSDCIEVLGENSVTLKEGVMPRYTVNLRGIDTDNTVYTNEFVKGGKNGFKTKGNTFSCMFTPTDKTAEPQKAVLGFLEENGFDTEHMKFSSAKEDGVWYITCCVGDYSIFDSRNEERGFIHYKRQMVRAEIPQGALAEPSEKHGVYYKCTCEYAAK